MRLLTRLNSGKKLRKSLPAVAPLCTGRLQGSPEPGSTARPPVAVQDAERFLAGFEAVVFFVAVILAAGFFAGLFLRGRQSCTAASWPLSPRYSFAAVTEAFSAAIRSVT
ncbi:hypothetical protein JCM13580A_02120 [Streptomyces drozdowiczii]